MSFGENLRKIRESKDMTQEQLAHAIGLKTKAAISKIEKGITDPNQSTVWKLANALRVSPVDFLDSNDDETEVCSIYEEYIPYLERADDRTIDIVRVALGMEPLEREKKSGSSGAEKIC